MNGKVAFRVGDKVGDNIDYIRSGSGPTCPTMSRARISNRTGDNAWQFWDGEKWVEDITIRVY